MLACPPVPLWPPQGGAAEPSPVPSSLGRGCLQDDSKEGKPSARARCPCGLPAQHHWPWAGGASWPGMVKTRFPVGHWVGAGL